MIRMVQGSTRIGSTLYTASSGAFSADEATEKRLVSLGVAEYVKEKPLSPKGAGAPATGKSGAGKNTPKGKNAAKGKQTAKSAPSKKSAASAPAPAADDEPIEDGEQPPALGGEDIVL